MKTPTPFGKSTLNNSPLAADGSDFPCKQRTGVYDAEGASNTMAIGSPQTLSFTGSAVHGGGSCQVSLTTDKQPSKSTKWQVIHSIEGGCPARSADGNLADGTSDADTYTFTVPDGIAPGDYTLAWTWFNRIGNREMYMNCAPVTVTAGGKKKREIERRKEATLGFTKRGGSFPDMFLANIGNGCTSADSKDLIFPDPGASLEKDGDPANLAAPSGNCGASVAAPAGTSGAAAPAATTSTGAAPSAASSPAGSPAAASSPAAAAPPAAQSPAAGAAPSAASSPPAAAPSASPAAGGSTGGSTGGGLTGACTTEGTWNCLGGSSFQRCASGSWSPVQPMPAGVKCNAGQSQDLAMNAVA
jgi:hypothetical protein